MRIEYRAASKELWMIRSDLDGTNMETQSLIGGVSSATFTCVRRKNASGQWILQRGTVDMTIEPGSDATSAPDVATASPLAIERGSLTPIRIVASTAPRQLLTQ